MNDIVLMFDDADCECAPAIRPEADGINLPAMPAERLPHTVTRVADRCPIRAKRHAPATVGTDASLRSDRRFELTKHIPVVTLSVRLIF